MNEHVLVVGCGFLGRRLASRLHRFGAHVTGLVHSESSAAEIKAAHRWDVACADVTSAADLARLHAGLDTPVTRIIHCASSGRGGADAYRAVFLDGCRQLIAEFPEAALLLTSSTSVYAQVDGEWVDEKSAAEPTRETGRLLRQAEDLVLDAGGTVARLAGLYGPDRSHVLRKLLDGSATIEGNGDEGRYLNQIHVEDAAAAIAWLAGHTEGGLFNVVDDHPETQRQCYSWLAPMFRLKLPPSVPADTDRKRGWTHKRVANRKLREAGWQPHFPSYRSAIKSDPELVPSILAQIEQAG